MVFCVKCVKIKALLVLILNDPSSRDLLRDLNINLANVILEFNAYQLL